MSLSNSGKGLSEIAQHLGRHKSTISGERKRNAFSEPYSSSPVQGARYARGKACRPRRKLDDERALKRVRNFFIS
ncbi:hypothetical protein B0D78_05010 [Pyramidobacter sp. C12-8]|nr:hypothetical protein B0D78_05010 [Pyramidobacter sp. C12-8]